MLVSVCAFVGGFIGAALRLVGRYAEKVRMRIWLELVGPALSWVVVRHSLCSV